MGITKTEKFNDNQNELAKFAKSIAHPARIAILEYLIKKDSCVCGDIVDELPLAQATVSQHLKELKNIDLIKGEIEGAKVCYCINKETWQKAQTLFSEFFNSFKESSICC